MFLEVMDKSIVALRIAGTKKSKQTAFSEINRLEKYKQCDTIRLTSVPWGGHYFYARRMICHDRI